METIAMSLEEYLGSRGLSSPISDYSLDKLRLPHGETIRQQKERLRGSAVAAKEYSERRSEAISEYNEAVRNGEIRPKTSIERLMAIAAGHEDNKATWAARRALAKRGIAANWYKSEGVGHAKSN